MITMRKLSYEYRIPSRSIQEVYEDFMTTLARHQRNRSLRFNGRKLSAEVMLNGAVMHFLAMSPEAQRAALEAYVPKFETMLVEEEPPAVPLDPPAPVHGKPVDPSGEKRRRKSS